MRSVRSPVQKLVGEGASRGALILDALVITAALALFATIVEALRPLPFASSGDDPVYYGPMIKLHTDALLALRVPRMFWEFGAGWTPFESGQVGLFYPPYVLANVVSRVFGRPILLLEVSAWLHLWGAGLAVLLLLPARFGRAERLAWSCLAMAQPAAFLLGMNWHDFISPYPWFLVMGLLLVRRIDDDRPAPPSDLAALTVASVLFWSACHPQMYVLGIAILGGWWISLHPRRGLPGLWRLAVAQIPLVVPVLYLRELSQHATSAMVGARALPGFVLRNAQDLSTVLVGAFGGNFGPELFSAWPGTGPGGQGLLFAPWLAWSWYLAARRQRLLWLGFSSILIAVLGIRTFPSLEAVFPAALGFRWTWKLALYVGPLGVLTVMTLSQRPRSRVTAGAVALLALTSAAVCVRGVGFDLWPPMRPFHARGFEGVVREARSLLEGAGVEVGDRIVVIARKSSLDQQLSVPLTALTGAAPIFLGLESAHTYEPLESHQASAWHGGLTAQWRRSVFPEEYKADPARKEAWLASIGVNWIVTQEPGVLPLDGGSVEVRDHLGRSTFLRRIPGAPPSFPWDARGPTPLPLERLPGGSLRSLVPTSLAPTLALPREVKWRHRDDGRWEGTPSVVAPRWFVLATLGILSWLLLFLRHHRHAAARLELGGPERPESERARDAAASCGGVR